MSQKTQQPSKTKSTRSRKTSATTSKIRGLEEKLSLVSQENDARQITIQNQRTKLNRIVEVIVERFDGDGVDDITLPTTWVGIWWWAISQAFNLRKMIKEIIDIVKS